ncbi:uncharacterized protein LOC127865503 [Dreissena polymorpha]|nr:uncharacterized protein LOC127865503 [Dreissena polymorpha]
MLTSLSQNQGAAVGNKDPNANPQGATGNVEEKFMMMFDSWFHERFGTKGTAVAEESKPLPAAPSPAAHPVTNQPWQSSATYHVTSGNAQNTQRPLFVIRQETSVGLGHPIQLKPVLPNPKAVIKPTFDIRDLILQPSPGVPLPPTKPNDVTTSTARPADGNVDKNTLFKEFMTMFKSELKGNSVVDASAQSATPAPSHYVTQQHVYSASPIPSPPVPAANPASFVVPPKPAPVFVPPKPAPVFVTPKPALVYIPATPIPPLVPAATHAPFVVPLKSVPIIITSTPVPPTVRRDEPVPVPRPNKPIPETRPKESHSESGGSGEARVSGERNQGRREGQQDHHSENQVLTRPAPTSRPQSTKSAPVSISMTHHVRENRPSRPRTPAPAPSPNRGSPPPTKPHVDKAVAAAEAVVQAPSLAVNTSVETPAPTTLAPTTAVPTIDPDLLSDINEARSYQGLPPLLPHQVDLAGNIKPRFQQRQQRLNLFPGRRHPLRDAAGHHEMFHRQVGPAMSPEVHQAIHVILSNTRPNLYGGFGGPATSNPGLAFNPAMDPDLMADIMEARGATGIHTPLY